MNATDNLLIARTIADQIGFRAFLMMGTKHKLGDADSLSFDVRGSRTANFVRVTLNDRDLYDVEFFLKRGLECRRVHTSTDIDSENLNGVIETHTGLCLHL